MHISESLTVLSLFQLFNRSVDAIHLPGFFPESACKALAGRICQYDGLSHYSMAPDIHIKRTGITLFETQYEPNLLQTYFETSAGRRKSLDQICYPYNNPNNFVQNLLNSIWPYGAQLESIDGKDCHYGTCRAFFNGQRLPPHIDFMPKDLLNYSREIWPKCQIAVNVYIKNPATGGELAGWNRPVSLKDLPKMQSGQYDFIRDDLLGGPDFSIKPEDGDLIFIRSSDIHAVNSFEGDLRIAFSFFVNYRGMDKPLYYYV